MPFSARTSWDLEENAFATAVRHARESGTPLLDLTISNPTACGFPQDAAALLAPLTQPAAASYEPDPLGILTARHAVTRYYQDSGATIPPQHLCLTTSTSEAYSFLFRPLCDPGDDVLVASPSYPLFSYLAQLDDVRLIHYPLLYDPHGAAGWFIDLHALESAITPRTRAVLVVHPNTPTGHFSSAAERAALRDLCARHNLALLVDEVFLDYALPNRAQPSFLSEESMVLTFVLSGISKICGLPQMKCSWIAASGPPAAVAEAMARLEVIADTFLSMNAPIQHALPQWLAARHIFQHQVRDRMAANLATLDAALHDTDLQRLAMDAGWTAVLRVPRTIDGAPFCEAALHRGVILQPGEFYGLPEGRAVLSLLTPEEVWREGLQRITN